MKPRAKKAQPHPVAPAPSALKCYMEQLRNLPWERIAFCVTLGTLLLASRLQIELLMKLGGRAVLCRLGGLLGGGDTSCSGWHTRMGWRTSCNAFPSAVVGNVCLFRAFSRSGLAWAPVVSLELVGGLSAVYSGRSPTHLLRL